MNRKGCIVENTGQSTEKCTVCLVWTQESENKRDVKSNCEAILPLIFAGFTKDRSSRNQKKSNGNTIYLKLPYYLPAWEGK